MKKSALLTAMMAALCYAATASAVPITGGSELSINGSDMFAGTPGGSTFDITFVNPANVGGESGSFAVLNNCTGCVTMIGSLTQASTNFELYSLTEGGNTSSLTGGSISSFSITAGAGGLESLSVTGTGTLHLSGFDPTAGFFELTTQGPSGPAEVTFSNTAIAPSGVPEPNSLALLAVGLIGFSALRRWRRSHSNQ